MLIRSQHRTNPAFNAEGVGEPELRRVAQLNLAPEVVGVLGEDIGIIRGSRFDLAREEEALRANEAARIGCAVEESAVVAANQVAGSLAQRIDAAVPPTH